MSGAITSLAGGATKYMGGATITVGDQSIPGDGFYGWFNGNAGGSDIDPNSFAATGAAFLNFWWNENGAGTGVSRLFLSIDTVLPNYGWEVLRIGSNSFSRTSATYSATTTTSWSWTGVANPFGTVAGALVNATWS